MGPDALNQQRVAILSRCARTLFNFRSSLIKAMARHGGQVVAFGAAGDGFEDGIPIAEWLRGPLRDWGEDLLSESSLRASGVFNPEKVRAAWRAHLSGRQSLHYPLWVLLMFQSWHRQYRPVMP